MRDADEAVGDGVMLATPARRGELARYGELYQRLRAKVDALLVETPADRLNRPKSLSERRVLDMYLQAERRAWLGAYGSDELRELRVQTMDSNSIATELWARPSEQRLAIQQLGGFQERFSDEWLTRTHAGWEQLRRVDARDQLNDTHAPKRPTRVTSDPREVMVRAAPVKQLMQAARWSAPDAQLAVFTDDYANPQDPLRPRRHEHLALCERRLPGETWPVELCFRESPEQARELDRLFRAGWPPLAALAERISTEHKRVARLLPERVRDQPLVARLERLERAGSTQYAVLTADARSVFLVPVAAGQLSAEHVGHSVEAHWVQPGTVRLSPRSAELERLEQRLGLTIRALPADGVATGKLRAVEPADNGRQRAVIEASGCGYVVNVAASRRLEWSVGSQVEVERSGDAVQLRLSGQGGWDLDGAPGIVAGRDDAVGAQSSETARGALVTRPQLALVRVDPEARWKHALAREEASIAGRAQGLCERLEERARWLKAQLRAWRDVAPKRPGFLGFGGKAYRQWQQQLDRMQARHAQLLARAMRSREYLAPAQNGLQQSKCRDLAVRRLSRAEPALVSEVLEQRRNAARRTAARDRETPTRSRGR